MHNENWDDLRYVFLLAQTGSMATAAQQLGVDRTTVMRRLAAFEKRLGFQLFHKKGSRYEPMPEAAQILDAAKEFEAALMSVRRKVTGAKTELQGRLTISTTDSIYLSGVSEMIHRFMMQYHRLKIDLVLTTQVLNLDTLETEVSIRSAANPADHLVGRHLCDVTFGIYGSEKYLDSHTGNKVHDFDWLVFGPTMTRTVPGKWYTDHIPLEITTLSLDTFVGLAEACRAGAGVALLPNCYATRISGLRRLGTLGIEEPKSKIWLLTHQDFKHLPRVRAFLDHMTGEILSQKDIFEQ